MRAVFHSLPCLLAIAVSANATTIVFDENSIPTNDPVNGFGSFTFDDFGAPGAVTETPTSIVLDINDTTPGNGVFGGLGVDFVVDDGFGNFVPQDFDPSSHTWELRVKLLPGNEATGINTTFIDDDGAGTGDEHQYSFDLTGVPDDGEFHLVTAAVDSPGFTQGAFGLGPGDGLVNPGLRQIQIQSQFGSTGRLNVEIDFVRIVPEPASAATMLLGLVAGVARRRG